MYAYSIRSKAGECVSLTNGAKLAVSEQWNLKNSLNKINTNADALLGIDTSITGANVKSVKVVADGEIICTYNNQNSSLAGETITLTPVDVTGSLTWTCTSSAGLDLKYKPNDCP